MDCVRFLPPPPIAQVARAMWKAVIVCALSVEVSGFGLPMAARPARSVAAVAAQRPFLALRAPCAPRLMAADDEKPAPGAGEKKEEEEGWTIDKVAALGLAGVLSIAVAETVFWVLSFPVSALVYYFATGEWIDLFTQDGQVKFLAFTAGWGALGGAIAQYRTVLTAAAMTPWMDRKVSRALSLTLALTLTTLTLTLTTDPSPHPSPHHRPDSHPSPRPHPRPCPHPNPSPDPFPHPHPN